MMIGAATLGFRWKEGGGRFGGWYPFTGPPTRVGGGRLRTLPRGRPRLFNRKLTFWRFITKTEENKFLVYIIQIQMLPHLVQFCLFFSESSCFEVWFFDHLFLCFQRVLMKVLQINWILQIASPSCETKIIWKVKLSEFWLKDFLHLRVQVRFLVG